MPSAENKGREAHSYLYHIIENYESLAGHVLFLQGSPFDHCHTVSDGIPEQEIMPLCQDLTEHFQSPENHPSVAQDLAAAWHALFVDEPPEVITFGAAASSKSVLSVSGLGARHSMKQHWSLV